MQGTNIQIDFTFDGLALKLSVPCPNFQREKRSPIYSCKMWATRGFSCYILKYLLVWHPHQFHPLPLPKEVVASA